MDVIDILERAMKEQGYTNKYEFVSRRLFKFITDDPDIDRVFVKKIFEVARVIIDRSQLAYLTRYENYLTYTAVCQYFIRRDWIMFDKALSDAYFVDNEMYCPTHLYSEERFDDEAEDGWYEFVTVEFSEENLRALMKWVKED